MNEIKKALARGYCTERNSKKVLDPDLIVDMAEEVKKIFPQPLSEEEVLEVLRNTDYMRYSALTNDREVDEPMIAKAISTHFCKPEISMEELERMIAEFMPHRDSQYIKPLALAIHKAMEGK